MNNFSKKFICFAVILTISMCPFLGVGAEDAPTLQPAKYDIETNSIILNIDTGIGNELVNITVLPADYTSTKYPELTEKNCIVKSVRTNNDGKYIGQLKITQGVNGLKSNHYNASMNNISKSYSELYPFTYVNVYEAGDIVVQLNRAANYDAFFDILDVNELTLGLETLEEANRADDKYKMLYEYKPEGGYTVTSFYNSNRLCNAIVDIRNISGDDATRVASLNQITVDYADVLPIDAVRYVNYSNALKLSFITRIAGLDSAALLGEKTLKDIVKNNLILEECLNAENYISYKTVFMHYAEDLGVDTTQYNSSGLTDEKRNKVFEDIFEEQPQTLNAIKTLFSDRVDAYYVFPGGSSTGGGGGTGGGTVKRYPKLEVFEDKKDEMPTSTINTELFSDVANHWAKDYIDKLYKEGKVSGYEDGTFKPEQKITRAEFIKIMVECFDIEKSNNDIFDDVSAEDWYYEYASAAYNAGILQGYNGNMNPNDMITREEVAVILYRTMEKIGMQVSKITPTFADSDEISEFAVFAVGFLQEQKVILGDNGRFNAKSHSTRAQMAAMVYRVIGK